MRVLNGIGIMSASVVALGACQTKPSASNSGDSSAALAAATAAPAVPNIVTVHAHDFSYDAPDRIPAGMTTFRLVNDGPGLHHLAIMRLDSAKTMADLELALNHPGPTPAWAVFLGGPNAGDPATETNGTVDLAAGNYAMLCFVDVPRGVPHFAKGMIRPLTVTPSTGASAAAPTADVVLSLSSYKFDLSQPLTAGRHTIKIQTMPGQPHEVVIMRLKEGKSADDMRAWMPEMQGPPPMSVLGGTTAVAAGNPVYVTVNLAPGNYILICFLPDAGDGKPHFKHGMMQTFSVT